MDKGAVSTVGVGDGMKTRNVTRSTIGDGDADGYEKKGSRGKK